MIKEKVYLISTERGYINDDGFETENQFNLKEFKNLDDAQNFCKEENKINSNYCSPQEVWKIKDKNNIPYYFDLESSDEEIQEHLENI